MNKGIKDKHVLGVYSYGELAEDLVKLQDDEIFEAIMEKLDAMFDGEASNYVKHTVQNWTNEPFIRGAPSNLWYTKLMANEFRDSPLNEQVFFAREFVAGKYAPTFHGICLTGRRAALNAIRKEYKYC